MAQALAVRVDFLQKRVAERSFMNDIRVMVVDDSRAMLGVMEETLREAEVALCHSALSGIEALSIIRQDSLGYDLMFIDLNMPGMDGMELIRELGAIRYQGGVVILSAMDPKILKLAEDVTKRHRVRLLGCISKPITPKELNVVLKKAETMSALYEKRMKVLTEGQIKDFIAAHQVVPYYQPKVSNETGLVMGLEVLARITDPHQIDEVVPAQFIPVAEEVGLVEKITFQLFDQALEDLPQLIDEFGPQCRVSINISPASLNKSQLPEVLAERVRLRGFSPQDVMLEVTEGQALEHAVQLETLNRLRIKGFGVALDDFGIGFTNIQQLKGLPFTEVKLDRSLVYNIASDHLSQVVAHSLFDIFGELDVDIVTEGVERDEDLNYLNALSIPLQLQGYMVSKPKPLDEICRWHHSWRRLVEEQEGA